MSTPAIIIAAPTSGAGKTTLTLAILRALTRRGLKVGSAKVGPDYIDPAFHAKASGRPCLNLDSWAMRFETLTGLMADAGRDCDIMVIEGAMGLFDGAPDGTGSAADLAAMFELPVALVVDGSKVGASAAALIDGFLRHRDDVDIDAIIFNQVGSANHRKILFDACDDRFSTPILGFVPRMPGLKLPERHLGLVQAAEHPDLSHFLDRAAELIDSELDLDRMIRLARRPSVEGLGIKAKPLPPLGQHIAIAKDVGFNFSYQATINGWHRSGAELSFFSPLADDAPHKDADVIFLPGGYPELHVTRIAGSTKFLEGLRAAAAQKKMIYGECGGYMVLGERLIDRNGNGHMMAGLLPVVTSFAEPKLQLGYRQLTVKDNSPLGKGGQQFSPLGKGGQQFRGHEFHYASEISNAGSPLFSAVNARYEKLGDVGCISGSVFGSYCHLIDRFTYLRTVD